MDKAADVSEPDIEDNRNWLSRRPFPIYIIVAWSLFLIIALPWSPLIKMLISGELAIIQFILILAHPLLLLSAGITLLLLKRFSLYLFIASLVGGLGSLRLANEKLYLIITFGIIIYCLWLRRKGILK